MVEIIFLHTLFLLIWFKTDVVIIYSNLLQVNRFLKIDEYEEFKNTKDASVSYHLFLKCKYPKSFWIKLITCPICLNVWICIPTAIIIGLIHFPTICLTSLFLYYLTSKLI